MILMIALVSVLVIIIITEGVVIYKQSILIKRKEIVYAHRDHENIELLRKELMLERKGLRHDTRGGDFCPACEGKSIAIIMYGYWTSGMWEEEIYNKEVKIGGCVVSENSKRLDTNGAPLIVRILTNTMGAFCTMLQEMRLGLRRLKKWMLQALQ